MSSSESSVFSFYSADEELPSPVAAEQAADSLGGFFQQINNNDQDAHNRVPVPESPPLTPPTSDAGANYSHAVGRSGMTLDPVIQMSNMWLQSRFDYQLLDFKCRDLAKDLDQANRDLSRIRAERADARAECEQLQEKHDIEKWILTIKADKKQQELDECQEGFRNAMKWGNEMHRESEAAKRQLEIFKTDTSRANYKRNEDHREEVGALRQQLSRLQEAYDDARRSGNKARHERDTAKLQLETRCTRYDYLTERQIEDYRKGYGDVCEQLEQACKERDEARTLVETAKSEHKEIRGKYCQKMHGVVLENSCLKEELKQQQADIEYVLAQLASDPDESGLSDWDMLDQPSMQTPTTPVPEAESIAADE